MAAKQKVVLTFSKEKETKNKIRFEEVTDEERPVIGTLYVEKSVAKDLGDDVTVTVEGS